MTVTVTSPITGSAQTGLTSPTYTHVADTAPDTNGKQYAVTALGGTQTGVDVHSVARPFTITVTRPKVLKTLQALGVSGVLRNVGKNTYGVLTRKGVLPLAGQASIPLLIRTTIEVPAGADLADPANVRAALSAHLGALAQVSAGLGDTSVSGVI